MSLEENKLIARRFMEDAWGKGDLAALDEIVDPDVVDHNPLPTQQAAGREGLREAVVAGRRAFPDMDLRVTDLIAEGDKVAVRWTCRMTHTGEFAGVPASGNRVSITGVEVVRISNGKIVEHWEEVNMLNLMRQIGDKI